MPMTLAVIEEPPPTVNVPLLPAVLPTFALPVAPTLTVLPPVIVMKPVPPTPPTCSDAPAAGPVKLIDEPPDMFSVPVPPASELVPPRMHVGAVDGVVDVDDRAVLHREQPVGADRRGRREHRRRCLATPLKKMTPSRFTVELSIVALPVPPLSATANRDATIVAPFVIVSTPEPVAQLLTMKLRWPLPSTDTVAPSLIVICPLPPLPTIT